MSQYARRRTPSNLTLGDFMPSAFLKSSEPSSSMDVSAGVDSTLLAPGCLCRITPYDSSSKPTVLFIAEKPNVAKTFAKELCIGREIRNIGRCRLPLYEIGDITYESMTVRGFVTSTRGHIFHLDFPKHAQPIRPIDLLDEHTEKSSADPAAIKHLRSVAEGIDLVVLCQDNDLEGERIAQDVRDLVWPLMSRRCSNSYPVRRCVFSALSASALQRSMASLVALNEDKALAVSVRQELDLRLGVPVSRKLTNFANRHLQMLPAHRHAQIAARQLGCLELHLSRHHGVDNGVFQRHQLEDVPHDVWEHMKLNSFTSVDLTLKLNINVYEHQAEKVTGVLHNAGCYYSPRGMWCHRTDGTASIQIISGLNGTRGCRVQKVSSEIAAAIVKELMGDLARCGASASYLFNAPAFDIKLDCDAYESGLGKHLETLRLGSLTAAKLTISYGPCQIPTLLFIGKSADDIACFSPKEEFYVRMLCKAGMEEVTFQSLIVMGEELAREHCEALQASLETEGNPQALSGVEMKRLSGPSIRLSSKHRPYFKLTEVRDLQVTLPPMPLNTVALCQLSSTQLGLSPWQTLQLAQELYEEGLISYPRTETSVYLADFDFICVIERLASGGSRQICEYAKRLQTEGFTKPRTDGHSSGDHEPIHPLPLLQRHRTRIVRSEDARHVPVEFSCGHYLDSLWDSLDYDVQVQVCDGSHDYYKKKGDLQRLISLHFLATLSPKLARERTYICIDALEPGAISLVATGSRCLQKGWVEIMPIWDVSDKPIFSARCDAPVCIESVQPYRTTTKAPQRITEPEVLALMERHGIGTDATMQQHLSTLEERGYIDVVETKAVHKDGEPRYRRELRVTHLGMSLLHSMILMDQTLVLPDVRAEVERDYTAVAHGNKAAELVVAQRLQQYRSKFESCFQSMDRDKLLLKFLAAGRGSKSSPWLSQKQAAAQKLMSEVILKKVRRKDSDPLPTPQERGDCISEDAIVWRVAGPSASASRVSLASVRAGDKLYALDVEAREVITDAEVGRLVIIEARLCVRVELTNESVLICTDEHPVTCARGITRPLGQAVRVADTKMYTKSAGSLRRSEDMVCILEGGIWIALPLLRDPQPVINDAPAHLVHITMLHQHHKPFVTLPEGLDPHCFGFAVGSSPESGTSDNSGSAATDADGSAVGSSPQSGTSDNSGSAAADAGGSSIILVGPLTHPNHVSLQELDTVPLDSQRRRTSFGSIPHNESDPTSCYLCWPHHNGPNGCRLGVLCERCHMEHPELPRRLRTRTRRHG